MSLRNKLLFIFLIISIVPVLIFTLFTYSRYTKLMDNQTEQISENLMVRAVEETNRTLADIRRIQEAVNYDSSNQNSILEDLHNYVSQDTDYTAYDVYQTNLLMQTICQNLFQSYPYLKGIYIFTPSGEILGVGNRTDIDYGYFPDQDEWYQKALALKGKTYIDGISAKDFLIDSAESISFSNAIYDVFSKTFLGVLYIDCSPDLFDLSRVNTMPEMTYLTISKGDQNLYENGTPLSDNTKHSQIVRYTEDLDLEGLTLTGTFNHTDLNRESSPTLWLLIFMCVICVMFFVVLSFLLSGNITKPIRLLSDRMASHDTSHRVANEPYMNRSDEIGILYNEYENMIEELDHYIKNELQNKLLTLNSQMRSLEAQINAHFLYNTLEAISSLAAIEGVKDISTMAESLSSMFRYSIKTKSELVTLREELDHVRNYVAIQQIRFDNGFHMVYDVPKEFYSLQVLKLILQPLVENALYHGLQSCSCGSCIEISAERNDLTLSLSVRDDGTGISQDILHRLEESLKDEVDFQELGYRNKQSIGIKNIHSRISLYYGSEYGIHISSQEGVGTTFTLTLPILEGNRN